MNRIAAYFLTAALLASGSAYAQSTIDPTVPASSSQLQSAPVRNNFRNAYNDVNNIIRQFAGTTAPVLPTLGQYWMDTSSSPYLISIRGGSGWAPFGYLDPTGNTFSPVLGPASVAGTLPIAVSLVAGTATVSLNIGSGLALSGSNLAISSSYIGQTSITTLGTISTGIWQGTKVGLAYGGTNADLGATGGTSQVLKQATTGAAITVGQLAASDLSNGTTGSGAVVLATAPAIAGGTIGALTSFGVRSTGAAFDLKLAATSVYTATRTLTVVTGDASRSFTLSGDLTVNGGTALTPGVAGQIGVWSGGTLSGSATPSFTASAAPSTPGAGLGTAWFDSTDKRWHDKNDAGAIGTTVVADTGTSNNFLTAISAAGAITKAQPSFSNISGTIATGQVSGSYTGITGVGTLTAGATGAGFTVALTTSTVTGNLPCANTPALTGNVTTSAGACATTIAASAVTNAMLANAATYSFKGNATASSAAPTDFTIGGLTHKNAPAGTDFMIISDQASSGATKYSTVAEIVSAAVAGVSSIAGNSGAFTLGTGLTNSVNVLQNSGFVKSKVQTFCPVGCTTTIAGGATGTYTPSAGLVNAIIECVGGGGGGGGTDSVAGNYTQGSGGGGGGYSRAYVTAATVGASKSVVIGAAGTAGAASAGAAGGAGGTSSVGSTLCGASGGGGGGGATSGVSIGAAGAGGAAGTGDVAIAGQAGMLGWANSFFATAGFGGSSALNFGQGGYPAIAVAGSTGTGYGGGGSGGGSAGATGSKAGGAGTTGYVVITEFTNQ